MFCLKQHDTLFGSGKNSRVDKEMANAIACLDYNVSLVVDSFSTHSFHFKTCSLTRQATVRSGGEPIRHNYAKPNCIRLVVATFGSLSHVCKSQFVQRAAYFFGNPSYGMEFRRLGNFREAICRRYVEGIFSMQSFCVEDTRRYA